MQCDYLTNTGGFSQAWVEHDRNAFSTTSPPTSPAKWYPSIGRCPSKLPIPLTGYSNIELGASWLKSSTMFICWCTTLVLSWSAITRHCTYPSVQIIPSQKGLGSAKTHTSHSKHKSPSQLSPSRKPSRHENFSATKASIKGLTTFLWTPSMNSRRSACQKKNDPGKDAVNDGSPCPPVCSKSKSPAMSFSDSGLARMSLCVSSLLQAQCWIAHFPNESQT